MQKYEKVYYLSAIIIQKAYFNHIKRIKSSVISGFVCSNLHVCPFVNLLAI